ncbi:hydrogen peroxide-inducible genes activator [Ectothiorhodospiraceae bacterium 2226]|nr:hydrogen peroxide-inducible genes activator [Ectothiorhodospiraceae bacterium 2226]
MTLSELRYVVALARERHFGRAAAACYVSQPTLSTAIKKLEEELGAPLFERSRAEVSITPLGREVVEHARRALEEVERIEQLTRQGGDPLAEPLRLGAIYTIGPYLLPSLIPALHKRAPQMRVLIEENYTAELAVRLKQRELDVVILSLPFQEPGVEVRALYDEPFMAAFPAGHPWEARQAVPVDQLDGAELLMLGPGHCFREQVISFCPPLQRAAAGRLQQTLEGGSLETIRHMVASGAGVTVLPCGAAGPDRSDQGLLRYRPLSGAEPTRRVALAWRRSFNRPAVLEVLGEALAEARPPCTRGL